VRDRSCAGLGFLPALPSAHPVACAQATLGSARSQTAQALHAYGVLGALSVSFTICSPLWSLRNPVRQTLSECIRCAQVTMSNWEAAGGLRAAQVRYAALDALVRAAFADAPALPVRSWLWALSSVSV